MTTFRTLPGHRASRSENSMDWSPEELLRELLAQIEAGDFKPTNMIVLWNKESVGTSRASSSKTYRFRDLQSRRWKSFVLTTATLVLEGRWGEYKAAKRAYRRGRR